MPFQDALRPSIQIGLLSAIVAAAGFPVRTLHANLDFAAAAGLDMYGKLSQHRGRLLGDWLFSVEAFGAAAPDPDACFLDDFAADLAHLDGPPRDRKMLLLDLRERVVPSYLDALVDDGPWEQTRVVGFTSTFQQSVASFALARRLKLRHPHLITVFGGANFDGEMGLELVRSIPEIDFAIIGEGDEAFPDLLRALACGSDPLKVPGVARRSGGTVTATSPAPLVTAMDTLQVPDYGEYFTRAVRLGILPADGHRRVAIPFESGRGCWWGAKHHCTFCGLNGSTMTWRAKSANRVLSELEQQARRYRSFYFEAVDNILDYQSFATLLPSLANGKTDYELFYEVKANLTRDQVRLLALAGVRHLQPGIESLSSLVLRLMRKGVRAAQNVNTLRWAKYYGVSVLWNLLWGFPGETAEDYALQAAVVPDLVHLQPPESIGRVWLERFSPLFAEPEMFPIRRLRPEASYAFVYPSGVRLDKIAYFFDYEFEKALPEAAYDALASSINNWADAWLDPHRPELTFRWSPGFLQIFDGRRAADSGTFTYAGPLADLYAGCSDRPTTAAAVRDRLALNLSVSEIEEILKDWQSRGLIFRDGELFVALALPATPWR